MADAEPTNPSKNTQLVELTPSPEPSATSGGEWLFPSFRRPPVRVTSEFDTESGIFFHKISSKLFGGLAKMKFAFQNGPGAGGGIALPEVSLLTKHFSILYDVETQNALLKGFVDIADVLQLRATHSIKDQQGEISMVTKLGDPSYKIELSSLVPPVALPKATLYFPQGVVSVEEKRVDEAEKVLSVNGIVKTHLLNGVCTAEYEENELNIKHCFKDKEVTFIPCLSLPSNALSFAFKRRFSPSDKLSYLYNFDSSQWSAVYKHNISKDLKLKAGYDSSIRLGWASLWVGEEDAKAKAAPMKMKFQIMVQATVDDIANPVFLLRVKKRWDF